MQARTVWLSSTSILALAALAALAVKSWPDRAQKRAPPGLDDVRAELRETRRELASMKRTQALLASQKLTELGASAQDPPAADPAAAEASVAPAANQDPPPELEGEELQQALAEEEAAMAVRYEKLGRDLEAEARDSAWANETEGAFKSQLAAFQAPSGATKPSIVSIECRTSLCKTELAFPKEDDAKHYAPQLARTPGITRGTWRHINTGGEVRTVAFLARGDRTIYPLRPNVEQ